MAVTAAVPRTGIRDRDSLSAAIAQLQVNEMLSVIANDRILFLTISRYDHATNPLFERLGNGQLFSLLEGDGQYDPGAVGNAILTNPDAVELSYYHGMAGFFIPRDLATSERSTGSRAMVMQLAGVWVPDAEALAEIGTNRPQSLRRSMLVDYAAGVCEVYSRWRNGLVYSFKQVAYRVIDRDGAINAEPNAYRHHPCLATTSSVGYLDLDECRNDALEAVIASAPTAPNANVVNFAERQRKHRPIDGSVHRTRRALQPSRASEHLHGGACSVIGHRDEQHCWHDVDLEAAGRADDPDAHPAPDSDNAMTVKVKANGRLRKDAISALASPVPAAHSTCASSYRDQPRFHDSPYRSTVEKANKRSHPTRLSLS